MDVYGSGSHEYLIQKELEQKRKNRPQKRTSIYSHGNYKPSIPTFLLFKDPEKYTQNPAYLRTDIDLIHSYIEKSQNSPVSFVIKSRENPVNMYTVTMDSSTNIPTFVLSAGANTIKVNHNGEVIESEIVVENALADLIDYPGREEFIEANKISANKKIICFQKSGKEPTLTEKYHFYPTQTSTTDIDRTIASLKFRLQMLKVPPFNYTMSKESQPILITKSGISPNNSIIQICSIDESSSYSPKAFTRSGTYQYYLDKANNEIDESANVFCIIMGSVITMLHRSELKTNTIGIQNRAYKKLQHAAEQAQTKLNQERSYLVD